MPGILTFDIAKLSKSFFNFRNIEIQNFVIDSRRVLPGDCFIAFKGQRLDGNDFVEEAKRQGAACAIVTELRESFKNLGIPIFYTDDPYAIIRELAEKKRSRVKARFVTITGSSGKTTTKEFTAQLLSNFYKVGKTPGNNNNMLGVSLALLNLDPDCEVGVFETGTNQKGEVKELTSLVKPIGSVTTNVGPSHLHFFSSVRGVFKAETEQGGWLSRVCGFWVLNYDNSFLRKLLSKYKNISFHWFSLQKNRGVSPSFLEWDERGGFWGFSLRFSDDNLEVFLPFWGSFNVRNFLAAVATAQRFEKFSREKLQDMVYGLKLPDLRSNVQVEDKLIIVWDCYNANPESFSESVDEVISFRNKFFSSWRLVGVFADMAELGRLAPFYHGLVASKVEKYFFKVFYVGEHFSIFRKKMGEGCEAIDSLENLARKLKQLKEVIILVKGSHKFLLDKLREFF